MAKMFLLLSAMSGFLAVSFGAFGAHALKEKLDAYHMGVFQTGVSYQFYHTFLLSLIGLLLLKKEASLWIWSGWSCVAGILIFSGSLYALALSGQKLWGAVTPIGGVLFLIAWAGVSIGVLKSL